MSQNLSRRRFLYGAAAAGAAAGGPFVITRSGWSQTGPIKIGVFEPLSGPVKYGGDAFVAATRFAADRVNRAGGVLGRKLEVIPADSELKPDVATRRANELIHAKQVDILAQGTASHVGKAVSQVASQNRRIFVTYGSLAAELTGAEFLPTTFRCCPNTDMYSAVLAVYFTRLAPRKHTTIYLLNPDYNFGHAAAEGFKRNFARYKAADQRIVGEEFHPLQKLQDFAPYVTKIMASGAEVVVTGAWGQDLRLLMQQGAALGWTPTLGTYVFDDPVAVQAVGRSAIGHMIAGSHFLTVDTPENREMIGAWRAFYPDAPLSHRYPVQYLGYAANAVLWLADVIKAAGRVETEAIIGAWEGRRFRAPWGDVEMRACDHQMLTPGYAAQIMDPASIPRAIRYFGDEMPYIGRPTPVPRPEITVPPSETGNPRCA
jgi:branched-chain amino acid transport system substrate-binding protein